MPYLYFSEAVVQAVKDAVIASVIFLLHVALMLAEQLLKVSMTADKKIIIKSKYCRCKYLCYLCIWDLHVNIFYCFKHISFTIRSYLWS